MSTFITRVELHDGTYKDYEDLHAFMASEGHTNTIRGGNGVTYHLPPAEYRLEADCTIEEARSRAVKAATRTRRGHAVFVSEYSRAAWTGLNS